MAILTQPTPAHAAGTLAAMGHPVRLRLLQLLGEGEKNVTELQRLVEQRQTAVSHHLTILKLRELVVMHRRGKCNYYTATAGGRAALEAAAALIAE